MFRVPRVLAGFILAAGAAASTRVHAEQLPSLDKIMTPREKQLFSPIVQSQLGSVGSGKGLQISVLDSMLAQDAEPTQFRGFLQFIRSAKLLDANRNAEAIAAVDESVRLLPGYSAPLLLAFNAYGYSNRSGDGADFLLRASEIDPDAVKGVGDYDVGNLVYRLQANDDYKHLRAVADKLIQIGWTGKQIDGRSKLAVYAIERHLADGDVAGARALVPELLVPEKTYGLLSDNRFRELWPALETWAGPRLERQWPIYLGEARARYATSGDSEHIIAYISALYSAGRDDLVISEALPIFERKLDPANDEDLIFVSLTLADALSRAGRWDDLQAMFDRAERVWPLDSQPNALNLFANQARFLLYQDRPAESVELMDKAIEKAKNWGDAVNSDAIAAMHLYRACALYRLGRQADAAASTAAALALSDVDGLVTLNFCVGNEAGARNALIAGFAKEASRRTAIAIMQAPSHPPCKSHYCTDMEKLRTKLRYDPAVLSELRKYGRVLPFSVNDAAKFNPKPKRPTAPDVPITI